MSFLANICFERPPPAPPHQYKRFGAIWFDAKAHRCSLMLDGIRLGRFFGKPHKHVKAEYIKGDIMVCTGLRSGGEMPIKEYIWCGWMWTDTNQEGSVYNGVIEVDPTPTLIGVTMNRIIAEWRDAEKNNEKFDPRAKSGFFLPVHLEDKDGF